MREKGLQGGGRRGLTVFSLCATGIATPHTRMTAPTIIVHTIRSWMTVAGGAAVREAETAAATRGLTHRCVLPVVVVEPARRLRMGGREGAGW